MTLTFTASRLRRAAGALTATLAGLTLVMLPASALDLQSGAPAAQTPPGSAGAFGDVLDQADRAATAAAKTVKTAARPAPSPARRLATSAADATSRTIHTTTRAARPPAGGAAEQPPTRTAPAPRITIPRVSRPTLRRATAAGRPPVAAASPVAFASAPSGPQPMAVDGTLIAPAIAAPRIIADPLVRSQQPTVAPLAAPTTVSSPAAEPLRAADLARESLLAAGLLILATAALVIELGSDRPAGDRARV